MQRRKQILIKSRDKRESCLVMMHTVKKKSIIMGQLDLLSYRRRIRQFAVLPKLLHYIFHEMHLVIFFANMVLDNFQELAIHLSSLHNFRTHCQNSSLYITILVYFPYGPDTQTISIKLCEMNKKDQKIAHLSQLIHTTNASKEFK